MNCYEICLPKGRRVHSANCHTTSYHDLVSNSFLEHVQNIGPSQRERHTKFIFYAYFAVDISFG